MDPAYYVAAGSLKARSFQMDLMSNNLANSATVGYKPELSFFTVFNKAKAEGRGLALSPYVNDGTVMAQGTVPAAQVLQGVSDWVECSFPLSHVLATGITYHLSLSAPADTQYSVYPLRKGADKGFGPATLFPDGYAQFTLAGEAGWTGWDMWGTPNLKTGDLQFLFIP